MARVIAIVALAISREISCLLLWLGFAVTGEVVACWNGPTFALVANIVHGPEVDACVCARMASHL